jgi:hypothetical protein
MKRWLIHRFAIVLLAFVRWGLLHGLWQDRSGGLQIQAVILTLRQIVNHETAWDPQAKAILMEGRH